LLNHRQVPPASASIDIFIVKMTFRIRHRRWFFPTKGNVVKLLALLVLVIHMISVFTVLRSWPADESIHDGISLLSLSSTSTSRNLSTTSDVLYYHRAEKVTTKQESTIRQTPSTASSYNNNNNNKTRRFRSSLNISELAQDLVLLEESTNATHVEFLKQRLNSSKIYRPGSWDGAGIVLEDHKLILFTQGKVSKKVLEKNWLHKALLICHNDESVFFAPVMAQQSRFLL
jgi:hypothetical protein